MRISQKTSNPGTMLARQITAQGLTSAPCGNEAKTLEKHFDADACADTPQRDGSVEVERTAMSLAAEGCKAIRGTTGALQGTHWNPRALAMLPAALGFAVAYSSSAEGYNDLCALLASENRRIPTREKVKIAVIAVSLCMEPPGGSGEQSDKDKRKADQTDCSRFAKVVKVAIADKVDPRNASAWLVKSNLRELTAKAAELNGKPRTSVLPNPLNRFKHLATALRKGAGPTYEAVKARLEDVLATLDEEVALSSDNDQ